MGKVIRKSMDVGNALFAGILCGFVSVFIDFDHVFKIILFPEKDWRFLHISILLACCIVLCCCGAYCGGLYVKYILEKRKVLKHEN